MPAKHELLSENCTFARRENCPFCDFRYSVNANACERCKQPRPEPERVVEFRLPMNFVNYETEIRFATLVTPHEEFGPDDVLFETEWTNNGRTSTHYLGVGGIVASRPADENIKYEDLFLRVVLDNPAKLGELHKLCEVLFGEHNLTSAHVEEQNDTHAVYLGASEASGTTVSSYYWLRRGLTASLLAVLVFAAAEFTPCEWRGNCLPSKADKIKVSVSETASRELLLVIRNVITSRQIKVRKFENEKTLPHIQHRTRIFEETKEKILEQEGELDIARDLFLSSIETLSELYVSSPQAVEEAFADSYKNALTANREFFLEELKNVVITVDSIESRKRALTLWNSWVNDFQ